MQSIVRLMDGICRRANEDAEHLKALGIDPDTARLVAPRPEAYAFVEAMNSLFRRLNNQEITTKFHVLDEYKDALIDKANIESSIKAGARLRAISLVRELFVISDEEWDNAYTEALESDHG